jgi:hypothetical protein
MKRYTNTEPENDGMSDEEASLSTSNRKDTGVLSQVGCYKGSVAQLGLLQ